MRKPDYKLKVKVKDGKNSAVVGVGWTNQDGSIGLVLNPATKLEFSDNLLITLFPEGTYAKPEGTHVKEDLPF